MSSGKLLLVAAVVILAGTATCLEPGLLDDGLRRVIVSSVDGGPDGGARDGGFRVQLRVLVDAGHFPRGAVTSALGPRGEVAGFGNVGGTRRTFRVGPAGELESWEASTGRVAAIRGFDGDGGFCGLAYWPDDAGGPMAVSGTAVVGNSPDAPRLLPDPVSSDCRGMSPSGITTGEWHAQGFVRHSDGGVLRLDLFPFPAPRSEFVLVEPLAMNTRAVVVGRIQYGDSFGRGNPAAFVWGEGAGAILLENGPRPATAFAVNASGVVGGRAQNLNGESMPMLWPHWRDAGIELPLPPGFVEGEVLSIDGRGLAAGLASDGAGLVRGVLWWRGRAWLADDLAAGQTPLAIERLELANDDGRFAGTAIETVVTDAGTSVIRWPIVLDVLDVPT